MDSSNSFEYTKQINALAQVIVLMNIPQQALHFVWAIHSKS